MCTRSVSARSRRDAGSGKHRSACSGHVSEGVWALVMMQVGVTRAPPSSVCRSWSPGEGSQGPGMWLDRGSYRFPPFAVTVQLLVLPAFKERFPFGALILLFLLQYDVGNPEPDRRLTLTVPKHLWESCWGPGRPPALPYMPGVHSSPEPPSGHSMGAAHGLPWLPSSQTLP